MSAVHFATKRRSYSYGRRFDDDTRACASNWVRGTAVITADLQAVTRKACRKTHDFRIAAVTA